jgi:hypothetical protein
LEHVELSDATLPVQLDGEAEAAEQKNKGAAEGRGGAGRGGGREGVQITDNAKCRRRKFIQLRNDKYAYL